MIRIGKCFLCAILLLVFGVGMLSCSFFAEASATNPEEPIMRIAFFSDLHLEFGLQNNPQAVRPSVTKAMQVAMDLTDGEGYDVVLVGGDVTGHRGGWDGETITKVKTQIHETFTGITKDGKVLYVAGNHDPDPSEAAGPATHTDYSGCYADLMQESAGEFTDALYSDDIAKDLSPFNEVLCYRYTFGGMEFIGISAPYIVGNGVSALYPQQTQWVEDELAEIGADKTVFILCHFPESSFETYLNKNTPASSNICKDHLADILEEYSNVVYCYGHVHSGTSWWAKKNTSELVKAPKGTSIAGAGLYKTKGYISSHMGSMWYYDTPYQPGIEGTEDSECVQFITVEVYADRLTFQAHNSGNKPAQGGNWDVTAVSFVRDLYAQLGVEAPEVSENPVSGQAAADRPTDQTAGQPRKANSLPLLIGVGVGGLVIVGAAVVLLVWKLPAKKSPPPEEAEKEE